MNRPEAVSSQFVTRSGAASVRHIRERDRAINGVETQHAAGEQLDGLVRPVASVELGEHHFGSQV